MQESVFFSGDGVGPIRADKRNKLGVGSNKKERRRTQSINAAFSSLRDCIPNVPCDTKLSKVETLASVSCKHCSIKRSQLSDQNPAASNILHRLPDKRAEERRPEQRGRGVQGGHSQEVERENGGAEAQRAGKRWEILKDLTFMLQKFIFLVNVNLNASEIAVASKSFIF